MRNAVPGEVSPALDPATSPDFKFERRVALFVAVAVVAVLLYLIVRDQPWQNRTLPNFLRALLAVAFGILAATVPGFLRVDYSWRGISVRAGGALAVIVITYLGIPTVKELKLAAADVSLDTPTLIDFRSSLPVFPRYDTTFITLDMGYHNAAEPGATARLSKTVIRFVMNGQAREADWHQFVNMKEDHPNDWLSIVAAAKPRGVAQGADLALEVLHEPVEPLPWAAFLQWVLQQQENESSFTVVSTIDGRDVQTSCRVALPHWAAAVIRFRTEHGKLPMKLTMCCGNNSDTARLPRCRTTA